MFSDRGIPIKRVVDASWYSESPKTPVNARTRRIRQNPALSSTARSVASSNPLYSHTIVLSISGQYTRQLIADAYEVEVVRINLPAKNH